MFFTRIFISCIIIKRVFIMMRISVNANVFFVWISIIRVMIIWILIAFIILLIIVMQISICIGLFVFLIRIYVAWVVCRILAVMRIMIIILRMFVVMVSSLMIMRIFIICRVFLKLFVRSFRIGAWIFVFVIPGCILIAGLRCWIFRVVFLILRYVEIDMHVIRIGNLLSIPPRSYRQVLVVQNRVYILLISIGIKRLIIAH